MIVNRQATYQDRDAVCAIWTASFTGDTEDDCRRFLTASALRCCYVAEVDGVVASVVFSVPAEIDNKNFQYIYAAATHPDYRSRGVFGGLLRFVLEAVKNDGYAGSFLHPAEPSLIAYYARFGYRPWTYCRRECGEAAGTVAVRPVNPGVYSVNRSLPPLSVTWPMWMLRYAATCSPAYAVGRTLLLCDKRGDTLYVKEQLGEADTAAVCAALGAKRYERLIECESGEVYTLVLPFGGETLAPPYIGPVFD